MASLNELDGCQPRRSRNLALEYVSGFIRAARIAGRKRPGRRRERPKAFKAVAALESSHWIPPSTNVRWPGRCSEAI